MKINKQSNNQKKMKDSRKRKKEVNAFLTQADGRPLWVHHIVLMAARS